MAFSLQHNSIPEIFLVFTVFLVWPLVKGTAFSLFPSLLTFFFFGLLLFSSGASGSQREPAGASGEEREGIVRTKLNSGGVMEGEGASLIRIV